MRAWLAVGVVMLPTVARADGAFPDSSQVLLPADKPNEIIVGTNFGLLKSDDSGATWQWVCEQEIAPCARLYQQAPPPSDAVFAVSTTGLVSVGNDLCQYTASNGLTSVNLLDAFIDPTNGQHILALGALPNNDAGLNSVGLFASTDGGNSFGSPIYSSMPGSELNGVEIAKSSPMTVYLTQLDFQPIAATILRSSDGGMTFASYPQSATLGQQSLRIAAVDPSDPNTIYFRASPGTNGPDSLVISNDGGMTTRVAKTLPSNYVMSTFLRQANGNLLVAGLQLNPAGSVDCTGQQPYASASSTPLAFRSTDGGMTFSALPKPLHFRGLGERGGALYAVADNFADGFAVGVSMDNGATWKPLLKYVDIQGPLTCMSVASTCAAPWTTLQTTFGIMPGMMTTPPAKHGCSYSPTGSEAGATLVLMIMLVGVLALRARRD